MFKNDINTVLSSANSIEDIFNTWREFPNKDAVNYNGRAIYTNAFYHLVNTATVYNGNEVVDSYYSAKFGNMWTLAKALATCNTNNINAVFNQTLLNSRVVYSMKFNQNVTIADITVSKDPSFINIVHKHSSYNILADMFLSNRYQGISFDISTLRYEGQMVAVIDLDSVPAIEEAGELGLTPTFTVKTNRGFHLYYTYPTRFYFDCVSTNPQFDGRPITRAIACGDSQKIDVLLAGYHNFWTNHLDNERMYMVVNNVPLARVPEWTHGFIKNPRLDGSGTRLSSPTGEPIIKEEPIFKTTLTGRESIKEFLEILYKNGQ